MKTEPLEAKAPRPASFRYRVTSSTTSTALPWKGSANKRDGNMLRAEPTDSAPPSAKRQQVAVPGSLPGWPVAPQGAEAMPLHSGPLPHRPGLAEEGAQPLLESTNSALSDLTHAPMALEQLASVLRYSGGTVTPEALPHLQSWVTAFSAAVQQAQTKGQADLRAQALLASLASMGSVQSRMLAAEGPAVQSTRGPNLQHVQPSSLHKIPQPVNTALAPETKNCQLEESLRPQPVTGTVASASVTSPRRSVLDTKAEEYLRRLQGTPASARKSQSFMEAKPAPPPPARASPAQSGRSGATNFRVYSNAFQNQQPNNRAPAAKTVPRDPPASAAAVASISLPQDLAKKLQPAQDHSCKNGEPWEAIMREEREQRQPFVAPQSTQPSAAQAQPAARASAPCTTPEVGGGAVTPTPIPQCIPPALPNLPSIVASSQGEQVAAWLRQRYCSLGQALSNSEANINRLASQTSSTLPLVLARLQAAQQLQGAAAAQGGLPAAAALGPLMQLQALVQSIGSTSAAAQPLPLAIPGTLPFSSLDAWRSNNALQGSKMQGPAYPMVSASQSVTSATQLASKWDALLRSKPSSPKKHAAPRQTQLAVHTTPPDGNARMRLQRILEGSSSSLLGEDTCREPASASRVWDALPAQNAITKPEVHRPAPARPESCRPRMPDPYNPFEMHRLRLSREDSTTTHASRAPREGGVETPTKDIKQGEGVAARAAKLISFHRSAPPLTVGLTGALRVSVAGEAAPPRAATVHRLESKDTEEEAEEQAAEILLSLLGQLKGAEDEEDGPHSVHLQAPKAYRRPRTQRTVINEHYAAFRAGVPISSSSGSPSKEDLLYKAGRQVKRGAPGRGRMGGRRGTQEGRGRGAREVDETWTPKGNARKHVPKPFEISDLDAQQDSGSAITQSM